MKQTQRQRETPKSKDTLSAKPIPSSPAGPTQAPTSKDAAESISVKDLMKHIGTITVLVFLGGYIATLIGMEMAGFTKLPLVGELRMGQDGKPNFANYYPFFGQYAIHNESTPTPIESQFSRVGTLGSGLFFYAVLNALQWTFEMQLQNVGGMFLIPLFSILCGGFVIVFKMLPRSKQTGDNAVLLSLLLGVSHAILVALVVYLGTLASSRFGSLFDSPYFYVLEMIRRIVPGLFILPGLILMGFTGLTYGAIAGGILSAVVRLRKISEATLGRK